MDKPFFIEALEKSDPKLLTHLTSLQDFVGTDGALSAKVKTLMSMLGDAILGHPEGVKAIAERARARGERAGDRRDSPRGLCLCRHARPGDRDLRFSQVAGQRTARSPRLLEPYVSPMALRSDGAVPLELERPCRNTGFGLLELVGRLESPTNGS